MTPHPAPMPSHPNNENDRLLRLEPVPTLLARLRAELSADFGAGRPVRVSRAPGRLDVMGGIADYTGSTVCEYPLDRAAAVAVTPRDDRDLQVFSFNLLDEHKPFTLRIPLDALANQPPDVLRRSGGCRGRLDDERQQGRAEHGCGGRRTAKGSRGGRRVLRGRPGAN